MKLKKQESVIFYIGILIGMPAMAGSVFLLRVLLDYVMFGDEMGDGFLLFIALAEILALCIVLNNLMYGVKGITIEGDELIVQRRFKSRRVSLRDVAVSLVRVRERDNEPKRERIVIELGKEKLEIQRYEKSFKQLKTKLKEREEKLA